MLLNKTLFVRFYTFYPVCFGTHTIALGRLVDWSSFFLAIHNNNSVNNFNDDALFSFLYIVCFGVPFAESLSSASTK
jgi:hypothetical protein